MMTTLFSTREPVGVAQNHLTGDGRQLRSWRYSVAAHEAAGDCRVFTDTWDWERIHRHLEHQVSGALHAEEELLRFVPVSGRSEVIIHRFFRPE